MCSHGFGSGQIGGAPRLQDLLVDFREKGSGYLGWRRPVFGWLLGSDQSSPNSWTALDRILISSLLTGTGGLHASLWEGSDFKQVDQSHDPEAAVDMLQVVLLVLLHMAASEFPPAA